MYYIEVRNYRGTVEYETQVSGYEALVKRITAIMRNYFYAIDVFTMEPFARMGGSSYRGWTTEDRKVHGATIKYGRAESGPLASRLNESLDLNFEDYENNKNVKVDNGDCLMKALPYGNNLIISDHGDGPKTANLPGIIAQRFKNC